MGVIRDCTTRLRYGIETRGVRLGCWVSLQLATLEVNLELTDGSAQHRGEIRDFFPSDSISVTSQVSMKL
jgi:hypothetical protein